MRLELVQHSIRIGLLLVLLGGRAQAQIPADSLLRLTPADAGITVEIDHLREAVAAIRNSAPVANFQNRPVFQSWVKSQNFRSFRLAVSRVEALLGEDLGTAVNELFGESVVLTLRVPPGESLDSARGLLLVRVPNRPLLDRIVTGLNESLKRSGELQNVAEERHGTTSYHVRQFRPGGRSTEYYTTLDGAIFVWSNSKDLLLGAIDRKASGVGGLADLPAFRQVRERMSRKPGLSLYINPRFIDRILASNASATKQDDLGYQFIVRSVAAMDYLAADVSWQDVLRIDVEESLDPARVAPSLKDWARSRPALASRSLRRVPKSTLAVFAGSLDLGAILRILDAQVPAEGRAKYENLKVVLEGLLMGRKLSGPLASNIGPELVGFIETPDSEDASRFPGSLILDLGEGTEGDDAGAAVANALRTGLALYALSEKNEGKMLRIVERKERGASITSLGPATPLAFAVHDRRLIVSSSTSGVARSLEAQADPASGERFESLRQANFPDAGTFFCVDLRALHAHAEKHRESLMRRLSVRSSENPAHATSELDQGLAFLSLFDAAFLTSRVDPEFTSIHLTLGLVPRPARSEARP